MTNNKCHLCDSEIPQERIEALNILGIDSHNFTCILCAQITVKPYRGIYQGFSGISPLIIVDKVGDFDGIQKENSNELLEED